MQLFHAVVIHLFRGRLLVVFGVQERWYVPRCPSFRCDHVHALLARPSDRWSRRLRAAITQSSFRGRNRQVIANLRLG
jgi:hypothetical protein